MMGCEHLAWTDLTCGNCGGFMGQICANCFEWSDGGIEVVANEDAWCNCANPDRPKMCAFCREIWYGSGYHECFAAPDPEAIDYQPLIVVASMQLDFEERGIAEYKRTHVPGLGENGYLYERIIPTLMAARDDVPEAGVVETETLRAELYAYHKRLFCFNPDPKPDEHNWWRIHVFNIVLAVSHRQREVLYSLGHDYETDYYLKGLEAAL